MFPLTGADEPDAVRKLMSLSEKVRPHNSKLHPLPAHRNLMPSPRTGQRPPVSPRSNRPQTAVVLSPESSSVVSLGNIALRKSNTTSTSHAKYKNKASAIIRFESTFGKTITLVFVNDFSRNRFRRFKRIIQSDQFCGQLPAAVRHRLRSQQHRFIQLRQSQYEFRRLHQQPSSRQETSR